MGKEHFIYDECSEIESNYIRNQLIQYNYENVPEDLNNRYEHINLVMKDHDGLVIGGLLSVLCWNWVEVDIVWVDASCRGEGYGSRLIAQIEVIAAQKKCSFIKLNTFSFQAPEFYIKQGYRIMGQIDNAPRGSTHYYFIKELEL